MKYLSETQDFIYTVLLLIYNIPSMIRLCISVVLGSTHSLNFYTQVCKDQNDFALGTVIDLEMTLDYCLCVPGFFLPVQLHWTHSKWCLSRCTTGPPLCCCIALHFQWCGCLILQYLMRLVVLPLYLSVLFSEAKKLHTFQFHPISLRLLSCHHLTGELRDERCFFHLAGKLFTRLAKYQFLSMTIRMKCSILKTDSVIIDHC